VLADGVARHQKVVANGVAKHFQPSQEERQRRCQTQRGSLLPGRTGWALTYLKRAGLVTTPKWARNQITDRGREAFKAPAGTIDRRSFEWYAELREFMDRSRSPGTTAVSDVPRAESSSPGLTPDEALEQAYQTLRAEIEQDLLATVKAASPEFLERLVVDLFVRIGYGGNREDAARAVGSSGDGGIDGVIDQDPLGLDVIYLQAKLWEGGVGRPEIQKCVGELQGQRARKGIFLMTSHFTKDAEDYVTRIDSRIILVDGRRLASLMFDYEVGVTPRSTYTVKSIYGDYFDEN
jgi:restriction system protein